MWSGRCVLWRGCSSRESRERKRPGRNGRRYHRPSESTNSTSRSLTLAAHPTRKSDLLGCRESLPGFAWFGLGGALGRGRGNDGGGGQDLVGDPDGGFHSGDVM